MIDIAFCVNDRYALYIGVTIKSLCECHRHTQVCIHVLTDFISDANLKRLEEIVEPYQNVSLKVYVVDDSKLKGLKDTWSIYTWYRVLVPELLPSSVHRILYLDADTLVTAPLDELFSLDLTGKAIACATDVMAVDDEAYERCRFPKEKTYVCAGVMVMNLDYWREHDLAARIIKFGFDNDALIRFPDQDTINILCQDSKIVLPLRFGVQEAFFNNPKFFESPYAEQLRESVENPAIVHFAGCAPWIKEFSNTVMHRRWMHFSRMLPHPVRPHYMTKGINGVKVRIHRLIFPPKHRTEAQILKRLEAIAP